MTITQLNNTTKQPELATSVAEESIIMSAKELGQKRFPDLAYYWGDLLRSKQKMAIIAAPKIGKSFFVMQLGLCIATGKPFLGMDVKQANVLYVNFEISPDKVKERLEDLCPELGISLPENFLIASIQDLTLEKPEGFQRLENIIKEAKAKLGGLGVLIIDPRRNAMGGDENQSEIVTAWDKNVDELRIKYNLAVVVVHHKGKNTKGAGRGSSVFDGWLDTIIKLEPHSKYVRNEEDESLPNLEEIKLSIESRDSVQRELLVAFKFPAWQLTDTQKREEESKASKASDFIMLKLKEHGEIAESDLRRKAMQNNITDYAFKTAMSLLRLKRKVEVQQDKSRSGNWKRVKLVSP